MEIYFRPTVDEAKDFARELCETIGGVEYVATSFNYCDCGQTEGYNIDDPDKGYKTIAKILVCESCYEKYGDDFHNI